MWSSRNAEAHLLSILMSAFQEFMKDDSFWGAVKDDEIEPESTLLDKPKHELKKKGPNTVVDKKKEEAMVATVDEEEKESISDAQKSCNDAKKKVKTPSLAHGENFRMLVVS